MQKGFKSLIVVFLLLSLTFYSSCTNDNDSSKLGQELSSIKDTNNSYSFTVLETSKNKKILFDNISIDTLPLFQNTKGIKIEVDVEILKQAFKELKKEGFSAVFFDLECHTDSKKSYNLKNKLQLQKRVHMNRDHFFSTPAKRKLQFQFPYRSLEMNEGDHEVTIFIHAHAVKFKTDSSEADYRYINHFSERPISYVKLKIKVKAPKLYKALITIDNFKLNTQKVNPQKFDFSFGGSGYPDIYWNVYCGEDLIYFSPEEKNSVNYNKSYNTGNFWCSKDDIIKISILDFDNGPFNTEDDIIDTWTGNISDLTSSDFSAAKFQNLSSIKIKASIHD